MFGSDTTMKLYEFLLACDYLPNAESNDSNLPYLIHQSAREQMQEDARNWMQQIPNASSSIFKDENITTLESREISNITKIK